MNKANFIKIYSSLPEAIRREIIVVVDNKPYTWDVAYIEVSNGTDLGKKIFDKMKSMGLIDDEK